MEITLLLEFEERGILPYLDVVEEAGFKAFNDSTMTTLQKAIEIAYEAHAGQYDKAGADYINHPLRVMEKGKTEEEKIVGVLHDVISRVLTNELAARVKLNDLEDNLDLSRLKTVSPADIERCEKYKRARALIMERLHLITIGQTHHDKE